MKRSRDRLAKNILGDTNKQTDNYNHFKTNSYETY